MLLPPDIITAAILGTDQSAFTLPPIDGPLGGLLAQLERASPEMKLLVAVVASKLAAQAGWIPPRASHPLPEPCDPDKTRPCGRRALRHLMVMVEGHYPEALPEWLRELAHQGKRVPEEALPLVLEAGRKHEHLRDLILPVIGQRGRWLALEVTNRPWNWFEPHHIDRTWDRGSTDSRIELLKLLRKSEPGRARELLAGSWQGEKAYRASFLQQLKHGLTMEDEPFLEAMLDDGAADIRTVAIHLLSRLPDSRFCTRMRERALPLLALSRSGLRRRPVLEVKPCPGYDQSMKRDGIKKESPDDTLPQSFWWSQSILYWVAPSFWCAQWQIGLEELIEITRSSSSPFPLMNVLAQAADNTGEPDSLLLLLLKAWNNLAAPLAARVAMSPDLTCDQREKLAIELLNTHREGFHRGHPAEPVLNSIDRTWSRELSEAFLASLSRYLQRERVRPDPDTRFMLTRFAQTIPLEMKDRYLHALDVLTSAEQVWREMSDEIRLLLDFRREMLEAIHDDH